MVDNMNDMPAAIEPAPVAPGRPAISPVDIATTGIVVAALGYCYGPNFADLYATWVREPDYSHGFLVLPIALVILYRLWPSGADARPRPWLPALVLVAAALGLRSWLHERGSTWSETATVLPVVAGLGLARLGWPAMRATWPAFAFLVFWLPLPPSINTSLSQPLQTIATRSACTLLHATGLWVMPEGNVIQVGGEQLEVAAACNGLSMLMSLAAAVAATAALIPMAPLKKLFLLVTIVPIALLSNILRISATAWCYYHFGAEVGSKYAHDAAGWLMMPTAMALVGIELWVYSWVVQEAKGGDGESFAASLTPATTPKLGKVGP